jgi:hypothetical protein
VTEAKPSPDPLSLEALAREAAAIVCGCGTPHTAGITAVDERLARWALERERAELMRGLVAPDSPSTAYEDIVRWLEGRIAAIDAVLNVP